MNLPASKESQAAILEELRRSAEMSSRPYRMQWVLNHFWMRGVRHFSMDYANGTVSSAYWNDNDDNSSPPRTKVEDLVAKFQAEYGRLMKMDIRPATKRRGFGLDSVRKAAAGRVILDFMTSPVDFERLKGGLFYHLLMFGTVGVTRWNRQKNPIGLGPSSRDTMGDIGLPGAGGLFVETRESEKPAREPRLSMGLIPAWQLYSVPAEPSSNEEVEAILRARWVPVDWVEEQGLKKPSDYKEKWDVQTRQYGSPPTDSQLLAMNGNPLPNSLLRSAESGMADDRMTEYVRLEEWFFLKEDRDRLDRWMVKIGKDILIDNKYTTGSVYCPIGICRYYPLGGFYGRSFVEILQPLNDRTETLAGSLFQNAEDMSAYPTTLIPTNWGVPLDALATHPRRNKLVAYEPSSFPNEDLKQIDPVPLSDFSGKALMASTQMLDRLTQQNEMMRGEAPGRVDSEAGLQFLFEAGSVPLSVPANSINMGLSQVYRAILSTAPDLMQDTMSIPLDGFDDNLIGLRLDPQSGRVLVDAANIPSPFEVEIGIRDKLPSPATVQEQKVIGMLKLGVLNPTQFCLEVWKRNLDLPVGNWSKQEHFRKATIDMLMLFGDGETPGQIITNLETINPEMYLLVLETFAAKAEFQYASVTVRKAFEGLKKQVELAAGNYPDQLPLPGDAALMQQQMQKQMMAGGQGGQPGVSPGGMPPG